MKKIAIVTGVPRGLGKAIADALEKNNYELYRVSRKNCDVTNAKEVKEYVKDSFDGFIEYEFYKEKFKIPKNYDKYLTYLYGPWQVPNKDFGWDNRDFYLKKWREEK